MIGSWITLVDPTVSEMMVGFDWDFLVVDMQHSTMSDQDMENHIRTIQSSPHTDAYVRVQENTSANIGRALDAGASGLIIPQVNNIRDAWRAIEAADYKKSRGMGLWRSNRWGAEIHTYPPTLIVQIEHKDAVEDIAQIMVVEGVDGFLIGMYDLSASLGIPGEFENDLFKLYMRRIDEFAAQSPKLSGIHIPLPANYKEAARFDKAGYFVVLGMDATFLWQGIEHYRRLFNERCDSYGA